MPQTPPVSSLIAHAFSIAMTKYNAELTQMTNLSGRMASRCLIPFASMDIQRQSHLDLLLRCMEDEQAVRTAADAEDNILTFHYQSMFSETWIGGWYEILRAIRQRADEALARGDKTSGLEASDEFKSLLIDFELLRIPLEKYEIAKDRSLKAPLLMTRYPLNNDESDDHVYDRQDPKREYHMPKGVSLIGNVARHRPSFGRSVLD